MGPLFLIEVEKSRFVISSRQLFFILYWQILSAVASQTIMLMLEFFELATMATLKKGAATQPIPG